MKIKGNFEVTLMNQKTFESKTFKGENLITNIGKKYLGEWLSHDNFSNYSHDNDMLSGGKTVLNEKIVSYEDVESISLSPNSSSSYFSKDPKNCMYSPTYSLNTYSSIYCSSDRLENLDDSEKKECSIYFQFTEPKRIKKIILLCTPYDYYGCSLEISTSPNVVKDNINWTERKNVMIASNWNNLQEQSGFKSLYDLPIYLGDRNDPEKIIENVRSIRITPSYYGIKIYKIIFVEEVNYPNPPFIIGLGTSTKEPSEKDKDLGNRICTLISKCTVDDEKNQVTYSTKIGINEYNGYKFSEIGLFCTDGTNPYSGQKLDLFSHGLFETPWHKDQDVVASIKYILTGENYNESDGEIQS